ncbi:MAG: HAD-IIIA family hydrolase [Sphingobacteriia bacterium]|nr:HAD-IIIA family hydrolase [Sphingobacteriia bacterium]
MTSAISAISKTWTLFLDRDGVINQRLKGDYVKQWEEFSFISGTLKALETFGNVFGRIIVVTNQQGVGKGLMTMSDLNHIHTRMTEEVKKAGGRIDKVYSCTQLKSDRPFCRKPNPGMALLARKDFPEIRFKQSIMAGDSMSDLKFGKQLGMLTVLISPDNHLARQYPYFTDLWFENLAGLADFLTGENSSFSSGNSLKSYS